MSDEEAKRDAEIADLVSRTYLSQYDLREKLDGKLNNFITITGTITTLSIGVALFVFGKIPSSNPYYNSMLITFLVYLIFFVGALIVGLRGYKPTKYTWYPNDCVELINEYRRIPTERQVVRRATGSYAKAANLNKEINAQKSRICNVVFWLFILGIVAMTLFSIFMILALGVLPSTSSARYVLK